VHHTCRIVNDSAHLRVEFVRELAVRLGSVLILPTMGGGGDASGTSGLKRSGVEIARDFVVKRSVVRGVDEIVQLVIIARNLTDPMHRPEQPRTITKNIERMPQRNDANIRLGGGGGVNYWNALAIHPCDAHTRYTHSIHTLDTHSR
jgi:hypothetical protein